VGRTKRDVVVEFRTTEILRAAERVFSERGFASATVAEIALAAGVAKGTVYLYFRSKEAIFQAAYEHNLRELRAATRTAMDSAEGTAAKLRAYAASKVTFFTTHRAFFALYLSASTPHGRLTGAPDRLSAHVKEQVAVLAGLLAEGQAAGEVRDLRAEVVAQAIFDVTRSVIVQRLSCGAARPADDDVGLIFDLVWKGISR
jgi:AcrR family transcriptional regulator